MKLFEICSDYEQLVDNINIEEKKELTNYNYKNGNIQCVDRSILFC
jgi:hypothetical protein